MKALQVMMQKQMEMQMEMQMKMQKQMMTAIAGLASAPPQAPTTPAFTTPVLPKKEPVKYEKKSPRRSPRNANKVSPRRSPRLVHAKRSPSRRSPKVKTKKLKRTLSWSEAFKNKQRMSKPKHEQDLRKRVGLAVSVLDDELLRGDYHDLSDKTKSGLKMNRDRFFHKVAPIIHDLASDAENPRCRESSGSG